MLVYGAILYAHLWYIYEMLCLEHQLCKVIIV